MLINATLIIDGEKLKTQIEIDEADLKAMQNEEKTGYERVGDLKKYYWIGDNGLVCDSYDKDFMDDSFRYDVGNYYSSKDIAENNARADQLMRQLRRFAVENREEKIEWNDERERKYYLYFNYLDQKICIDFKSVWRSFGIYFDSYETAERAIEEFKDELTWYFTEYKDSL